MLNFDQSSKRGDDDTQGASAISSDYRARLDFGRAFWNDQTLRVKMAQTRQCERPKLFIINIHRLLFVEQSETSFPDPSSWRPVAAIKPHCAVLRGSCKEMTPASGATQLDNRPKIQPSIQTRSHFPHKVNQDPRGLPLPRFVNAGSHLPAVNFVLRPASKNPQDNCPLRFSCGSALQVSV